MLYDGERCINYTARPLKRYLAGLLKIAFVGSLILWLYLILLPAPTSVIDEMAGGQVFFAVNRNVILQQDDCIQLTWSVSNIEAVYLNDEPQIGEGESTFCNNSVSPTLNVVFRDGAEMTYSLPILILLPSWLSGIIIILFLTLVVLYHHRIRQQPRQFVVAVCLAVAILSLFLWQTLPLASVIATGNWLEAATALEDLITIVTVTVFGLMISIGVFRPRLITSEMQNDVRGSGLGLWVAAGVVSISIISGIILFVNPRGMYVNAAFKPHQLLLRDSKTQGYLNLTQPLDIVIMGSSRAFTLSPAYIEAQTGYETYNMAIEGGRIEDILIQSRQMPALPPVMLIEIQQGLPREANDIAFRAPLNWIKYMSSDTALLTLEKRFKGLLDLSHLSEAIYISRYQTLYERQPEEWPLFEANGFAHRPLATEAELEQAILLDIGNIPPVRCDQIEQASQSEIAELIQMASAQNTSLVFYISPWHPRYFEALLQGEPQYQRCHNLFTDYMGQLDQQYEQVFFVDYSQLALSGNLDTSNQGYYDSQHLTEANSQRLLDNLLPTLQAAYEISNQKRRN